MPYFKQALIQLRASPKESLLLGAASALLIAISRYIPYLNAFFLALGLLILQEAARTQITTKSWPKNFDFLKNEAVTYIVMSLILLPTIILAGSALGVLQSPQSLLTTLPLSFLLLFIASYFYIVLSHSLRYHIEKKVSLAQSIDIVGLSSVRNFKNYFLLSFYGGILLLVSEITWGVGFIISLPLIFYFNYFFYSELDRLGLIEHAQRQ